MSYELYRPQQTLQAIAPELWLAEGPLIGMSIGPLLKIPFPTRMTVVRLPSGELWIHSPIASTPGLLAEVAALGPVAHLISPNAIHYAGIPEWQRAFPKAKAWASPGVRARARSQKIAVDFDDDLRDSPPDAWAPVIEQMIFAGSRVLDEVVFFHRPSRTLILTDLIENFEGPRSTQPWRFLLGLAGALDPDGKTPIDFRATFFGRRHRAAARACRDRMIAWEPTRVVLAHGRWYPHDGVTELRRAFRWLDP